MLCNLVPSYYVLGKINVTFALEKVTGGFVLKWFAWRRESVANCECILRNEWTVYLYIDSLLSNKRRIS